MFFELETYTILQAERRQKQIGKTLLGISTKNDQRKMTESHLQGMRRETKQMI